MEGGQTGSLSDLESRATEAKIEGKGNKFAVQFQLATSLPLISNNNKNNYNRLTVLQWNI